MPRRSSEAGPDPAVGLTHASFFSGVGGLDQGLERAGWRTLSFSEIDPYANAVLARHWPDVPNLGDITTLNDPEQADWHGATLFSGGFPCQDLSIAGKRKGLAGGRSGLAYAFLTLVERHRPRALLLENVPGLLSSHRGRDLGALLGLMGFLGYGVAYRVLDARFFGVPQRRRRVFILGLRSGPDDPDGRLAAERAAEVLSVGTSCPWHPPTGTKAGPVPAGGPRGGSGRYGVDYVGSWQAGPHGHHGYDQASVQGHLPVVSHAITTTHTRTGRLDPNGETFVVAKSISASAGHHGHSSPRGDGSDNLVVGDVHAEQLGHRQRDEPDGGLRPAADGDEPRDRHGPDPEWIDADRATPHAGRDGAADGLGGRMDHRPRLEGAESHQAFIVAPESGQGADLTIHATDLAPAVTPTEFERSTDRGVRVFVKSQRAREVDGHEKWIEDDVAPTLNVFDVGDSRAVTLVQETTESLSLLSKPNSSHAADLDTYIVAATLNNGDHEGGFRTEPGEHLVPGQTADYSDPLLPEGLDSHRYRCCGNGVVSTVAEWIGVRLAAELSTAR